MGDGNFMINNSKCFIYMAAHILLQLLKLLRDGKICLGALQLGFTPSWALGVGCTLTSAPDLFWSARSPSSSLNLEYNHLVDLKSSIYKYLANTYWALWQIISSKDGHDHATYPTRSYNVILLLPTRRWSLCPLIVDLWDGLDQRSMANKLLRDFWS